MRSPYHLLYFPAVYCCRSERASADMMACSSKRGADDESACSAKPQIGVDGKVRCVQRQCPTAGLTNSPVSSHPQACRLVFAQKCAKSACDG
jgi:hypothetical protein